ncbi:MAG: ribonuclease P protein component [Candidatus Hydrogenedens sp.]|nr:ribonuclease P protein component [Candidatus Hydrogenedens sp.]
MQQFNQGGHEPSVPDRFRFPRAKRLTRKAEFDLVFQQGRKLVGRHFVCYAVRREEPDSQLGLVVSRKVGNAVARNRVKRYLRQLFRTHCGRFDEPIQLVVIARHGAADLDFAACEQAFTKLLRQGNWLRE